MSKVALYPMVILWVCYGYPVGIDALCNANGQNIAHSMDYCTQIAFAHI